MEPVVSENQNDEACQVRRVLGQQRRAKLSVQLAHQLHSFLESQERSRFEDLRIELLLQEKLWAVEASKLERDLGSFGLSNASHRTKISSSSATSSALPVSETDDALAVVWTDHGARASRGASRGASRRGAGCYCIACWGSSGDPSGVPCRSAMDQTGQLYREIGAAPPVVADAAPNVDALVGGEPDAAAWLDFREHLRLLLAARVNVMAAENSLQSLKDEAAAMASRARSELKAMPGEDSKLAVESLDTGRVMETSIKSAGLKQLMALKPAPLSAGVAGGLDEESQDRTMTPKPKEVGKKGGNSKVQQGLSSILTAVQDDDLEDVPEVKPAVEEVEQEVELSDEITEEFANSLLQMAEARAALLETEVATTGDESKENTKMLSEDVPGPIDSVDPVEASRDAGDAEPMQQDAMETTPTRRPQQMEEAAPRESAPVPQAAPKADRATLRKQREAKVLQWQKASDFLKNEDEERDGAAQLSELLLEAESARRRLQEVRKHRRVRMRLHSEAPAGWLKVRSQEAVALALQPPWEEDKLRSQKIQRILQSSHRAKSQIFSLTACTEAVVAAYDAERSHVTDLFEMLVELDPEGEAQRREQSMQNALQALEREVAKSLRSISECRRLLLDLFDKGATATKKRVKDEHTPSTKATEPKVDERRRSAWAKVYADLLDIDAKDSTTITLKTSQGVAWAKT